jgi:hypothetical protein
MITCPECGTLNSAGTEVCQHCGAALGLARSGVAPGPGVAAATRAIALPPPPLPQPIPAAAPEPADEEGEALDPNHLETFTAYGESRRIVTVIGFGASGKTFLINRLRDALPQGGRWTTHPRKQETIEITPEGLWLTEVNPARRGAGSPYVLIDCAGESFQRAFDEQSTRASLSGIGVRSYLTALACASAYVFVIEAEHLAQAAGGTVAERAKVAALSESFYDIIDAIRIAKAGLARLGPKGFLAEGISKDELRKIRARPGPRLPEPLFVALSQADRLDATEPLDDPLSFGLAGVPVLSSAIENRFARFRFDFISSFFGHDAPDGRVDYRLPHYGVVEMFDWLDRQLDARRDGWSARLAGDLDTSWPLWLRRRVDAAVRPFSPARDAPALRGARV